MIPTVEYSVKGKTIDTKKISSCQVGEGKKENRVEYMEHKGLLGQGNYSAQYCTVKRWLHDVHLAKPIELHSTNCEPDVNHGL